jgi:uncharacterized protein YaeQ
MPHLSFFNVDQSAVSEALSWGTLVAPACHRNCPVQTVTLVAVSLSSFTCWWREKPQRIAKKKNIQLNSIGEKAIEALS